MELVSVGRGLLRRASQSGGGRPLGPDRRVRGELVMHGALEPLSVQVIVHLDDDGEGSPVVREVFALDRDGLAPDTLGLRLAEAKDLLVAVQDTLVAHQVGTAVAAEVACPRCGLVRRHKDQHTIVVRSLFGTLRLPSPRWWHCPCTAQPTRTFRPLAVLLPERTHA